MIKITYQKKNGELIERKRQTINTCKIGETTSMGWKVLDIQYLYNGKYYHSGEYDQIIEREWQKAKRRARIKTKAYRIYKELGYAMGLLFLIRGTEIITRHIT